MSKEKQISEMAYIVARTDDTCKASSIALALYGAGYRKQKEGEWVTSDIPQEKYCCSVCGGACWYYDYQGDVAKSRYCPNCGAHMRKEDEGKCQK